MMMAVRHTRLFAGAALLLCALATGGCHEDEDGLRVDDITFRGTSAVSPSELKAVMATREGGWLPWSKPRYFDRAAFEADLDRIRQLYRDRGYPEARIVSFDARVGDDDQIRLEVTLDEGEPLVVEEVRLVGFDAMDAERLERLRRSLPLRPGDVQQRTAVTTSRDMALRALQDYGFAHARVDTRNDRGSRARRVVWTLTGEAGPKSYFGPIEVNGNASVGDDVIRRELEFRPGEVFSLGALQDSQRRLLAMELFQYANVEPRLDEQRRGEVPVRITVAEAKPRQLQGSVGFGTEEKARAEGEWRHRNFLGGARTGGVEAKWSSLDRGVRANFAQPFFLGSRQTLTLNGQRWYYDEPAYQLDATGVRVALNRARSRRDPVTGRGVATLVAASAIYEFERYRVSNEALADLTLRDELISLGLDPRTGRGDGALVALAFDVRRDTTTNLLDARQGYIVSGHVEQAGWWMPGSFNYVEVSGEARHYLTLGPRLVLANRLKVGSIEGLSSGEQIPFFKRYFLGGSTSLRGWGRYDVAPLSASGLPLGGHSVLEASSELRVAAFGKVGLVAFVDAGNVWPSSWEFDLGDLRYAVGPGLRYDTPIGPVRFDVGYQLTPIEGLLVDGEPERRRWRMHFSIGHAF
jgi:outer membrane protein insertion porin family/translocation and assembly module TamA